MTRLSVLPFVAAATLFSTLSVRAADMPTYAYKAPPVVQEFGSGWYLRGDIGYRLYDKVSATPSNGVGIVSESFDNVLMAGAGFGFKSGWFRADLTADYGLQSRYSGNSALFTPYVSTKIDAITLMANAYADLGTWGGFTPYIGAGAGASILRTITYDTPFHAPTPQGRESNFAWAAMAGIGYNVTPNLLIDAGYRYIDLGSVKSGVPQFGPSATFGSLTAHEARLGVRYMID